MFPLSLLVLSLATLAASQSSSVNLFLPQAYYTDVKFAASVVDACAEQTVYAIQCTAGQFASTVTCDSKNGPTFTVTEGASKYQATTHSSFTSALMTLTESCTLTGTTEATCTQTLAISSDLKTTTRITSSVYSGPTISDFYIYQIPVTAGASALQATGASCSSDARATKTVAIGSLIGALVLAIAVLL